MVRGALVCVAMGLAGAIGAGCSAIAGIEDLQLTGSPDGASEANDDVTTGSSSGSSASSSGTDGSGRDATVDSPADVGHDVVEASVCTSGQTRCSGSDVETCTGGAWGPPVSCASGMCSSGACTGACTVGQVECSGNGVQTCVGGKWGTPAPCMNQTCAGGACTGVCAPGQTNPVACGNCGTDAQTCNGGAWMSSGTCSGQGVCAPGAMQGCGSNGMQTCSTSCSWGSCVTPPTDCPGTFKICDGFESGTTIGSQWHVSTAAGTTIVVDGTHPHLGSNALHMHYAGGGTQYIQTYIQNASSTVFPLDTVYVRAWFSVSAITGLNGQTLVSVQSNANTSSGVGEIGFEAPGGAIFDDVEDLASGNWGTASTTATMPAAMPYGPYTCLELGIDASYNAPYPNGVEKVWQDVSSSASYVADLLGTPALLQTLRGVLLGMQFQAPASAFDLYIDDIAVDTSYVPCDQ